MKTTIWAKYTGKAGNKYDTNNFYHIDLVLFPKQGLISRIFAPCDLLVKCSGHKDCAYTEESFIANWEIKEFNLK